MENPVTTSLWFAMALYAVIGVIGVIVLRDTAPNLLDVTTGYGVSYGKLAVSAAVK